MKVILAVVWLLSLIFFYVEGFSSTYVLKVSRRGAIYPSKLSERSLLQCKSQIVFGRSKTQLQLDVFGLGPYEVLMVGAVGVFLYGPDKLRQQLQKQKGVDGVTEVSNPLVPTSGDPAIIERIQRIADMQRIAKVRRRDRALVMIQEAIERNDAEVIRKMEEYEGVFDNGDEDDEEDSKGYDDDDDEDETGNAVESVPAKGRKETYSSDS